MAVTRDRITIGMAGRGRASLSLGEPVHHRGDDLVERQPVLDVELGREPDLRVHDPVGRQVLGALRRHPGERVALLHDADGVLEGLEVELERLPVRAAPEPRRELGDVLGRQVRVPELAREVDDGRRAQAAVEMVVEQRLGRLADRVQREHRVPPGDTPIVAWPAGGQPGGSTGLALP